MSAFDENCLDSLTLSLSPNTPLPAGAAFSLQVCVCLCVCVCVRERERDVTVRVAYLARPRWRARSSAPSAERSTGFRAVAPRVAWFYVCPTNFFFHPGLRAFMCVQQTAQVFSLTRAADFGLSASRWLLTSGASALNPKLQTSLCLNLRGEGGAGWERRARREREGQRIPA